MSDMSEDIYSQASARISAELADVEAWGMRSVKAIASAKRAYVRRRNIAAARRAFADAIKWINAASAACHRVALWCEKASDTLADMEAGNE